MAEVGAGQTLGPGGRTRRTVCLPAKGLPELAARRPHVATDGESLNNGGCHLG